MRYEIWKKDDYFEFYNRETGRSRIDMDPSVVILPHDAPLGFMFDFDKEPLGIVREIRLEDGAITGEITFIDPLMTDKTLLQIACRLGGYYDHVEKNEAGDQVLSCSLKAVGIVPYHSMPGWPKDVLNKE